MKRREEKAITTSQKRARYSTYAEEEIIYVSSDSDEEVPQSHSSQAAAAAARPLSAPSRAVVPKRIPKAPVPASRQRQNWSSSSTSQLLSPDGQTGASCTNPNEEADIGIIEHLTLTNFMCHNQLQISFSPNVNFILGRNGSGKSAIMAGIMIGLGGRASHTDRGRSLKQFIRSGASSSSVKIRLRNRGPDAYRHDEYGDAIIVERVISKDGSGSYKIKSKDGTVVSSRREELVSLLDHCNIQIDNPVSLLNQDTSRHFLQKSTPTEKYHLFMKASHLEDIALNYERAQGEHKMMKVIIERMKTQLPDLKGEAKELEEKLAMFEKLADMKIKVDSLKQEFMWAEVALLEQGVPPLEEEIASKKKCVERKRKKLQETETGLCDVESEEKAVRDEMAKVVAEAEELLREKDVLALNTRRSQQSLAELNSSRKSLLGKLKDKDSEKQCLEDAMRRLSDGGKREEREMKMRELRGRLAKLESDITAARSQQQVMDEAQKQSAKMVAEILKKILAEECSISNSQRRLRCLQASRSDQLAVFGPQMKMLVEALQRNQHRFSRPPIGPIGSKIALTDYQWTTAVEQVLKRSCLSAFIVDNNRDGAVFRDIEASVCGKSRKVHLYASKYQDHMYDVTRNKTRCNYPTVYDVLQVDDPNVMNVLIDQLSVESILLIRTRAEATEVMVHQRPRGAKAAYTAEGDQVVFYGHYSNKEGHLGILHETVDTAIAEEQTSLAGLQHDLTQLRSELTGEQARHSKSQAFSREVAQKVKEREGERMKVTVALQELEAAMEEEDVATYEGEIAELMAGIEGLRQELVKLDQRESQLKHNHLLCFQKTEECQKRRERVIKEVDKLKADMGGFEHKQNEARKHISRLKDSLANLETTISDLEAQVSGRRTAIARATQTASEACPRMTDIRCCRTIRSELSKLEELLQQEAPSDGGEQEEVEEAYVQAMKKFEDTQNCVTESQRALDRLQSSMKFRLGRFKDFRDVITNRVKDWFSYFLFRRGYDGKLKFYHEEERLEVEVDMDCSGHEVKRTSNAKALSGGERSLTTVCFVMSLWDAIGAPFRCLDEFDVFMDMMNRRLSMELMLTQANDHPNRQFIILTPQDMSFLKFSTANVKVMKLLPPEKGQTALNHRDN